jgi:class 3 adenylate cyclase/tetratricopeptide (TPR) repeat protein
LVCSNCGAENEAGRKFCGECATLLVAVCTACGTSNSPTARFCGECAAPLVLGAVPAGSPSLSALPARGQAPVAERRLVSVLFADLVGFTTLAEGRDAEDTRELLSHYFDLARDVIGRYGGTVEKFIGDAVMAVWGAPTAHEDDAERAVRAALELVDAVRGLGPGIAARAGVLTGEAAVTLGATNQGMVAGDLVNTASRLQSAAEPGTVLVGEGTQRATSRAIAFATAGELTLKGKGAPVPAWRALRVVAEVGGRGRSGVLEAPFVGRDDELRLLKDLFHATTRERRARLVSIIGPAGIGKSRLAWEFLKYIDGLVDDVWWHDGRSPAYGDGISFWALGEMVRSRCGLLETDDELTTRTKVAETLAEHVPDPEECRWVEPALLALLGVEWSPGTEQLFGAWRMFFERLAATAPVVMVFEDFHHADSGLVDFVDHLVEWSRALPIYVVTLARPDLLEHRPEWGAAKRNFVSVYLEPLPGSAMHQLLAGLVPGLPESAERVIVGRADGIPLYAVETVRMLLSEGKLALDGGSYRPVGDLTILAVPETLTALITSRLDGLPLDARALISDAAVLGQSFTLAGLVSVSALGEIELEPLLRSLVRHEILALETDPRSPERGQYAFVQALIREVAYNTLAKRDRKRRHLAAARYFESLETEEIAGGLAGHYLAAYRNSPSGPEADAVAGQARIALRAAADRAIALGSYDQALTFLEQALAVSADPADSADLLVRAGDAATANGRYETAHAHLRTAIAMQRELGDRRSIAGATAKLGRSLLNAYQTDEALGLLEPAVDEFGDLVAAPAGIALSGQLARAYFFDDRPRRAIEVADRVLEAAEHADLPAIVADTLVTRGTALADLGRSIEGLGAIVAGRDLAESLGLGLTVLRAENNRAYAESLRDPRAALETSRAGLVLARRLGDRSSIKVFLGTIGELAVRTGDWAAALATIEAALAEEFEPFDRATLLMALIPLVVLRGQPVDDHVIELRRLLGEGGDLPQLAVGMDVVKAFMAFAAGDLIAARAAWLATLSVSNFVASSLPRAARAALWSRDVAGARQDLSALEASGIHGSAVEADRRTLNAGLSALEGRPSDALSQYREALRAWRVLGLAWDEALCGIDMATLLDPADPEVRAAAEASRDILIQLEAVPFVARLDAELDRSSGSTASSGAPTETGSRHASVTTP